MFLFTGAVVAAGCGQPPQTAELDRIAGSLVSDTVVAPTSLTFSTGALPSGETVAALATKQLSGTTDTWSAYVEFAPGARAVASYQLSGTPPVSLASAAIRTNFRGPAAGTMKWVFEAFDFRAGIWVLVGDNSFAASWVWSSAVLPLPAPVDRFLNGNELRVRYGTDGAADASDVDELVIVAGGTATPAPTPAPAPVPAPVTPPAPTSPAANRWQPHPGTTWQIQLQGTLDTSVAASVYDIDLFDTSAATIAALRAAGRRVICYFSAGSYEDWRPDASQFPDAALGNQLDGWPGERWLDTRAAGVRAIMRARMDLAVSKGCDAVDPDNVDGYTNGPGFPLTAATQLDYDLFLASEAHARGLAAGLKNNLGQIGGLVDAYDFAVNEQCQQYSECGLLAPFIARNKPVFGIEYATSTSTVCPSANAANFDTDLKKLDLGAWRLPCR